jgi:hypothetical protein
MAAAAVSSSLVARGCLNVHAFASQSAVARSSTCSGVALAWNPLHRRTSRLSHLSSSAAVSSIAFRQTPAETQRSSGLKLSVPRASKKGNEELEVETEVENEVRDQESEKTGSNRLSQFLSSAAKPAAVAMLVALMLAQPSEDALAASGGRIGGKAFSAPRAAPSRPYSGGGGGGGGYSGGRGYSAGGGGVYVAPPIYGSPYGFSSFGYSPFYGGGYGGGIFAPSIGFGGGGTIILAMIAFATLRAVVGFVRNRFRGDDEDDRFDD